MRDHAVKPHDQAVQFSHTSKWSCYCRIVSMVSFIHGTFIVNLYKRMTAELWVFNNITCIWEASNVIAQCDSIHVMVQSDTSDRQCPGRFLGIIGQNPSVSKSYRLHFWSFGFSLLIWRVYSIDFSKMSSIFPKVLNFDEMIFSVTY
jgi:hypothetical protein